MNNPDKYRVGTFEVTDRFLFGYSIELASKIFKGMVIVKAEHIDSQKKTLYVAYGNMFDEIFHGDIVSEYKFLAEDIVDIHNNTIGLNVTWKKVK